MMYCLFFFFFKQKTAYEMRISDWSSDVCSSDLLAQAREFHPDLVITDIHLPHVSGLDLIISLKRDAQLSSVPIMAVTAYAGHGDEERIREAGAQAYVSKPISMLRFVEQVNALL